MDPYQLDDAIRRGNGMAALAIGIWHDLRRPVDPLTPIGSGTVRMRLPAWFAPGAAPIRSFNHPLYEAILDSSYTRVGDYLVGPEFTWFVVSQQKLLPVICAKTTRVVSVSRPAPPVGIGLGGYGGVRRSASPAVLSGWPASVIAHGSGLDRVDLPGDAALGGWSVLLPALPSALVRTGDVLTDDLGRSGVVSQAELSDFGWRLVVRQAAA